MGVPFQREDDDEEALLYGAAGAVCKARRDGFRRLWRFNGLLCMFNGFAIPKPFCRKINGL
jgi:hypothetical protein